MNTKVKFVTIYFDERYYEICRRVFDWWWYKVDLISSAIKAREASGYDIFEWAYEHQKEWVKITGIYAGENGKIIYRVKSRDLDKMIRDCELLKEAGIVSSFDIEESE